MKAEILLSLCLTSCVFTSYGAKLPTTFKRCNLKSPELNECLMVAIPDALNQMIKPFPKLGLPSLEPLEIPSLTIGAGSGPVDVVQKYTNTKITGLSGGKPTKINFDLDKKIIYLEGTMPKIDLKAHYALDGKILVVPIKGEGSSSITLHDSVTSITLWLEEYESKGKKYYRVTQTKVNIDPSNIQIQLDNLFNGDERLGQNINKLINENWKDIYADIRGGYEGAMAIIFQQLANNLFSRVPVADIFEE